MIMGSCSSPPPCSQSGSACFLCCTACESACLLAALDGVHRGWQRLPAGCRPCLACRTVASVSCWDRCQCHVLRHSLHLLTVSHAPTPTLCRVCGEERGAPSKADRASVLSRLLDLPRLLEICALYGPVAAAAAPSSSTGAHTGSGSTASQLSQLMSAALQLLPQLRSQLAQAAPLLAQNLGQVAEACMTAAGKAGRDPAMTQSLQGESMQEPIFWEGWEGGALGRSALCCWCLLPAIENSSMHLLPHSSCP